MREYYEPRLGDFTNVGFRICEGLADAELHRCLMHQEYQVLVLPYRDFGIRFAGRTIEEFAYAFGGPVVHAVSHGTGRDEGSGRICSRRGCDSPGREVGRFGCPQHG